MKKHLQISPVIMLLFLFSCQKPIDDIPTSTNPPPDSINAPFTNRDWQMDTIVVTPPADYNMLSDSDKIFFDQFPSSSFFFCASYSSLVITLSSYNFFNFASSSATLNG
jgi:hypothetical protein